MKRWTIGVDPGATGGIAFLSPEGGCHVYPMPMVGKEVDLGWIKDRCDQYRSTEYVGGFDNWHAWIEEAQAFPGVTKPEKCRKCGLVTMRRQAQGVVSTGTFMRAAGLIEGCFVGMGIDCTRVKAKEWQNVMLTGMRGRSALKAASIAQARDRFPSATFKRTPRCTTYSDGMTDSALVAAYGSRITLV